jgi:hypothetical protein
MTPLVFFMLPLRRLLLDHGANPAALNIDRKTPLDLVEESVAVDNVNTLAEVGRGKMTRDTRSAARLPNAETLVPLLPNHSLPYSLPP